MTAPVIIRADRLATLMPECRDPAEIEIRERLLMGCDTAQAALARDWDKSSAPLLQMMTGIGRSFAFAHVGLDYEDHVSVDPSLVRPPEQFRLTGDPSRARDELGWQPAVSFEELIGMMVDADVERHRATQG